MDLNRGLNGQKRGRILRVAAESLAHLRYGFGGQRETLRRIDLFSRRVSRFIRGNIMQIARGLCGEHRLTVFNSGALTGNWCNFRGKLAL
jgi:hypothetical protein